jgi:hypothetical protein
MHYRLDLICPRCDNLAEAVVDRLTPLPRIHCSECLLNRVEIVVMTVLASDYLNEGEIK